MGRRGLAADVARALQRCPGRACMALLFYFKKFGELITLIPKTLGSVVHYVPYCRTKGKILLANPMLGLTGP